MSDRHLTLCDPVEYVCRLYGERKGEIEALGWSLADVYLELGGGGPESSELHERFPQFFNGQVRGVLAPEQGQLRPGYWAGMPERAAALREEALEVLSRQHDVEAAKAEPSRRLDPRTRAQVLAHNQVDAELHAHFAGMLERDRRPPRTRSPRVGRAVCVLGMSRSGTSLTTRILDILGVDLGAEEELMAPAADNNPAGFWEHKGIADLNEDILATLGEAPRQAWRHPPPLKPGWEDDPRLEPHRRAAAAMLRKSFAGRPLWGWKDPRTCLTLPFWLQLVPDMRYVICVRNPLEIAASLEARDGISTEESLRLWLRYMRDAMAHTSGQQRLFISYESYFSRCEDQAKRLATFLELPAPTSPQQGAIAAQVDATLWHHRAKQEPDLPAEHKALYALLLELAQE